MPSGILIHPAVWPQYMGEKVGYAVRPPFWGEWVSSELQTGAENLGAPPLLEQGAGSPSNTTWPGLRPTYLSSGILFHPAVWPQQTWAKNWRLSLLGKGSCIPI